MVVAVESSNDMRSTARSGHPLSCTLHLADAALVVDSGER